MGTIVCQGCGQIIAHFESNQVKTLYGVCQTDCRHKSKSEKK
ncbi:GapA-binding peptide SR1P [Brevibacillus ruminantium]|uniref:GapA-binding peptide SR1P n=1 Tax=Brevibacillus ruminantium TaxID=2950604 RepID=A0ABY4WN61_9BACL|nr:GapA-binding peptide SR1P [Brevibacillus ruminantium]USG67502.1 GapA-binding peptide SR1P [Brevibacillus ruminantium]